MQPGDAVRGEQGAVGAGEGVAAQAGAKGWGGRVRAVVDLVQFGGKYSVIIPKQSALNQIKCTVLYCTVCPDFFRENARVIAQNARKNAPA